MLLVWWSQEGVVAPDLHANFSALSVDVTCKLNQHRIPIAPHFQTQDTRVNLRSQSVAKSSIHQSSNLWRKHYLWKSLSAMISSRSIFLLALAVVCASWIPMGNSSDLRASHVSIRPVIARSLPRKWPKKSKKFCAKICKRNCCYAIACCLAVWSSCHCIPPGCLTRLDY